MQNPSFEFPRALALATALAAIFPAARAQQAPAFDMDPVVITAVAPDSPLTFITNPKTPRQPLPASDGTDYLKTIPGSRPSAMAAPTAIRCCAACSVRA